MDTETGCIMHDAVAESDEELCLEGEVISLLPTKHAHFIDFLVSEEVLIPTNKYNDGRYEKQPIFTTDLNKAEEIGLAVTSFDELSLWKENRSKEIKKNYTK